MMSLQRPDLSRAHILVVAAAQLRADRDQGVIADLQTRLDAAGRSARDAAESAAVKVKQVEDDNRALRMRLSEAQQTEAEVAKLADRLEEAQAELQRQKDVLAQNANARATESIGTKRCDTGEAEGQVAIPAGEAPVAPVPKETVPVVPADGNSVSVTEEKRSAVSDKEDAVSLKTGSSSEAVPPQTTSSEGPSKSPAVEQKADRQVKRKSPKQKKPDRNDQMDLFGGRSPAEQTLARTGSDTRAKESEAEASHSLVNRTPPSAEDLAKPGGDTMEEIHARPKTLEQSEPELEPERPNAPKSNEHRISSARPLPPPPPVDLPELRKAVNQILPLLTDQDPGAKDCLKANRATFRSAFSSEAYAEFEQLVKTDGFSAALEHLQKAARKHGIPVAAVTATAAQSGL